MGADKNIHYFYFIIHGYQYNSIFIHLDLIDLNLVRNQKSIIYTDYIDFCIYQLWRILDRVLWRMWWGDSWRRLWGRNGKRGRSKGRAKGLVTRLEMEAVDSPWWTFLSIFLAVYNKLILFSINSWIPTLQTNKSVTSGTFSGTLQKETEGIWRCKLKAIRLKFFLKDTHFGHVTNANGWSRTRRRYEETQIILWRRISWSEEKKKNLSKELSMDEIFLVFATVVYYGKPDETEENSDGVFAGSVPGRGRRCGCNYEGDSRGADGLHFEIWRTWRRSNDPHEKKLLQMM